MVDIIKIQAIHEYCKQNPQHKAALEAWASIVRASTWDKPEDIVLQYGAKAIDLLGKKDNKPTTFSCKRVVFDISGNNLRVIAKYQFHPKQKRCWLYMKWIGTHAEYDKVNAKKLQYEIEMFK